MTIPGPAVLGRGVVVRAGSPVPAPWADAPVVTVDSTALTNETADRLHELWVQRRPVVVEWHLDDDDLALETSDQPPWALDAGFLFPVERLRFLCFSNNYDARDGESKWWWSVKAASIGATPGGPADVTLSDGSPGWIDGGPRQPLESLDHLVIHGETIDAGLETPVGGPQRPAHDLAEDQAEAVDHLAGAARIIAPAGSGKTRTLAARLRHLLDDRKVEEQFVTAVAYNTRAADELRQRTGAPRRVVRTIHSLGWAILGEHQPGLELMGERDVRSVLGRLVSVPKRANADPLGPYIEALDQVRAGLVDPDVVEVERDDVPGFGDVFERYRQRLYRAGTVDHGEQVYGAIEALLRDEPLRRRWQFRCRHLLVDEFQDLTPAYLLLLRLVASPQLQVFGVGDDDQVIYGYAGADPGFLIDFDSLFPGAAHHALETNYRCPPSIVDGARTLLGYNRRRIVKTIHAFREDEIADALVVESRPGPKLAVEAAATIERWVGEGVAPADIAVLARVNSSLIPIKAALAEAGIPTNDLLSPDSLRRTTLRALFAWMRMAMNPDEMDRSDILEAIRRPSRGLNTIAREMRIQRRGSIGELADLGDSLDGKQAQRWDGFCDDVRSVANAAQSGDATRVIRSLVQDVGLATSARTLDAGRGNASRSGHIDDLVAVERSAAVHRDLADFMPWLSEAVAAPAHADGVTLSSVHRVKGMEWSRVIVFGADRGAWPHDLATDTEEERRVFHVALTRAIDQSVVLADESRPSRLLRELDGSAPLPSAPSPEPRVVPKTGDEVVISGGYAGTVVGHDGEDVVVLLDRGVELTVHPAEVKDIVSDPEAEPDADLLEALKAWRLQTSKDRGVPAYVVFHDSTLEEIARRRPASERELLAVPGIGARKLEDYGDDLLALIEG